MVTTKLPVTCNTSCPPRCTIREYSRLTGKSKWKFVPPHKVASKGSVGKGCQPPPRANAGEESMTRSEAIVAMSRMDRRMFTTPFGSIQGCDSTLTWAGANRLLIGVRDLVFRDCGLMRRCGSPRLALVREPDQLGVERANPQLAFGVRRVE